MAVTLMRRGGEREKRSLGKKKEKKKKASICVCLPTALYIQHAAHEFPVDWQNEALAIKMVIFPTPLLF